MTFRLLKIIFANPKILIKMKKKSLLSFVCFLFIINFSNAQADEQTGAWYMYFLNTSFSESSWGMAGDVQYRNYDLTSDMSQLFLRAGLTYSPNPNVQFTAGYANVTIGKYGESTETSFENRIYQEAALPHKISNRIHLAHRFRYEQRWVEEQDFRTRYRYNLYLNVPLLQPNFHKNSLYLTFFSEIFLNGQKEIGTTQPVQIFDRYRLYSAVGYSLNDNLRLQLGYLNQITNSMNTGQVQVGLHHSLIF